jgi:hypothetical protein
MRGNVYGEMQRNEKEVAMCFKILSWHSPNTAEEDHRNLSQKSLYLS